MTRTDVCTRAVAAVDEGQEDGAGGEEQEDSWQDARLKQRRVSECPFRVRCCLRLVVDLETSSCGH